MGRRTMVSQGRLFALAFSLLALPLLAETTVGVAGLLSLPQGGTGDRRRGGAAVRFTQSLDDDWALEGEAGVLEDSALLAARARWFWHGAEEFNRLFGYERFDPFFTLGVRGILGGDAGFGPTAGLGALYYLTDEWALRFDAEAGLNLDGEAAMIYAFGVGIEYAW